MEGALRERLRYRRELHHHRGHDLQLAWRWLRFQPESELSRWFAQRTMGAKGRIRKVMIIALSRKLLITLWRYVETGLSPANLRFATAAAQGADM